MNDLSRTLRALLAARGMTITDLAMAVGLSVASVRDQVEGRVHLHRRVRKIEVFLGTSIWTDAEKFSALRRASDLLGADAVLTGFHELRRRAIRLRVPYARRLTSKDDLVAAVLAHATPTPTNSPHEKAAD